MRILAVDPGSTVGWALRDDMDKGCGQFEKWHFVDWFSDMVLWNGGLKLDGIICERMEITARTLKVDQAGVHDGLDVIGACRWLARSHDVPWHWQSPAQKNRISDAKLKELGLWVRGQPHSMDARRHLTLFEMKTGLR